MMESLWVFVNIDVYEILDNGYNLLLLEGEDYAELYLK